MFFRLGAFTTSLILWSSFSLLWMSRFHVFAIFSVLLVLTSLFFQDKWKLSPRQVAGVGIACLLMCYVCTRVMNRDATGLFLGIGTISLA